MNQELNDFRVSLVDALFFEEGIEQRCRAEGIRYLPAQAEVYRKAIGLSNRSFPGRELCASLVDLFLSLDEKDRYGGIVLHGVCLELDKYLASQSFQFSWDDIAGRTGVAWILMVPKEDRMQIYRDYPEQKPRTSET